jgi:alkylhydroperoxidase family enzyme
MTRIKASIASSDNPADDILQQIGAIWAYRPSIGAAMGEALRAVREEGTLSPRLRELVRLRIAFHNQCRTCMAVRYEAETVSEGLVCSLERPAEASELTAQERAALHFADLFSTNHLAIDDAVYQSLREHFDEGELVELGGFCALMSGLGRLMATWHIVESLPPSYLGNDGPVAPWRQPDVVYVNGAAGE